MRCFAIILLSSLAIIGASCAPPQAEEEMFWKSKEERFWKWFQANETRMFDYERDEEKIFEELSRELKKVHPDLVFEFGPQHEKRDFTVSADGIKDAFQAVIALVDKAPPLERWNILKFRQRGKPDVNITLNGQSIRADQIKFTLEPDSEKAGITLYIDGYDLSRRDLYDKAGFILLDNCLGEYDMETKVGFVEFKPASEQSSLPKQPLSELPTTFDKFISAKLN